ncbi:skin secretory protein xP2-like [Iris pallida]|uniref:Skin secretory protein xP2-like n=1 Tax=Iris pallida TaxID=29817 RepID=A0AAX6GDW2_IRIPA|nr:skin secretory protein xP2-like [Iris pallida]
MYGLLLPSPSPPPLFLTSPTPSGATPIVRKSVATSSTNKTPIPSTSNLFDTHQPDVPSAGHAATTILTCRRVCVQHIRSITFTNYSVHMIRVRCPGHGHTTSKVSFSVSKSFGHATLKSNITTTTNLLLHCAPLVASRRSDLLPRWPPFVADTRRRGRACARMRVSLVGALASVERSPSRTSAVEG